jgi:uncharacterized membrane protein
MPADAAIGGVRRRLLVAAALVALVWIGAVIGAPIIAARGAAAPAWQRQPAAFVYLGASFICHQQPDRSFHVHGVQTPLCARCLGVHMGAALGLIAAALAPAGWARRLQPRFRPVIGLAVLPTLVSLAVEWLGGGSPLLSRTLTAFPAGASLGVLAGVTILAPPRAAGRRVGRTAARDPAAPAGR